VTADERQALLDEYGLTEDDNGYGLTLRGLQQGLKRAYELCEQGNVECREILGLDGADERRARLALHLQAEAFSMACTKNSWGVQGRILRPSP
jgi:hypothetical protein